MAGSNSAVKSREEIAAAYSSHPWWYDVRGFFILTLAYRSTLWAQVGLFGRNMGPRHLEGGIGTATLFDIILKWRRWKGLPRVQVVGIDYAEPMLAGAKDRLAGQPDIELKHADIAALPYADAAFDTANIANAVHCFPDVDAAFREVFRVLRPGGTLAANVLLYPRGPQPLRWIADRINAWGMRKGILVSPFEATDVSARLRRAGFEIAKENISGNTYNVVAVKPGASTSA